MTCNSSEGDKREPTIAQRHSVCGSLRPQPIEKNAQRTPAKCGTTEIEPKQVDAPLPTGGPGDGKDGAGRDAKECARRAGHAEENSVRIDVHRPSCRLTLALSGRTQADQARGRRKL